MNNEGSPKTGISIEAIRMHGYNIFALNCELTLEQKRRLICESLVYRLRQQEGLENINLLETKSGYQIDPDSISNSDLLSRHLINEYDNRHSNVLRKQTIRELNDKVKQKIKIRSFTDNHFRRPVRNT